MGNNGKTYDDFINAVWVFESSIDPSQQSFYDENWNKPTSISYPEVDYPGRVKRDPSTGKPIQASNLTVQEYFTAIGLASLYDPTAPSHDWRKIQAAVINYLGFVGFQFQESDLQVLGYYTYVYLPYPPASEAQQDGIVYYPEHYVDVPVSHWENGVTVFFTSDPALVSKPTWVTDTVHFVDANFTGKNGIGSNADFMDPDKQIYIIKDHFTNKYQGIVAGLEAQGKTLADFLGTDLYWDQLDPPVSPPPEGLSNKVDVTLSGLLAGAHLRGAGGIVDLLINHKNSQDENGTYILQYVQVYAGYQTPFAP